MMKIKFTEAEALEAIAARISGTFDNKQLKKLGALHYSETEDVRYILQKTQKQVLCTCIECGGLRGTA